MFTADITGNKDILSPTSPSPEHPYPVLALSPAPSSTAAPGIKQAVGDMLDSAPLCLALMPSHPQTFEPQLGQEGADTQ